MNVSARPSPAAEVAFFRDPADTWFAAQVIRLPRWNEELLEPLDPEEADIRVAFLQDMPAQPYERPNWLCLLPRSAEHEPRIVVEAAQHAWASSAAFRDPGPPPEAYLVAGYQALCPPHPPCEPGPGMRASLMEFLVERSGTLGRVARESDDGANRLLRIFWRTPEDFAEEILRSRIRDDGGRGVLQLVGFLEAAEVARDADEFAALTLERDALLERLTPLAYFSRPADYDRAAAIALDWRDRYNRAYQAHYRGALSSAREIVSDTAEAARLLRDLHEMNHEGAGTPIGEDAARRLRAALDELAALPEGVDERSAQTAGVMLGRVPVAIAEARLAAAAVLAAVDVHRRRLAARGASASAAGRHGATESGTAPR